MLKSKPKVACKLREYEALWLLFIRNIGISKYSNKMTMTWNYWNSKVTTLIHRAVYNNIIHYQIR